MSNGKSTNYLNIDELAPIVKTLELKGKTHEMHQVSVEEFLKIVRTAREEGEKSFDDLALDERVEKMVENIMSAFPTIPREDLVSLKVEQLLKVIQFISGTLEEEAQAQAEVARRRANGKN